MLWHFFESAAVKGVFFGIMDEFCHNLFIFLLLVYHSLLFYGSWCSSSTSDNFFAVITVL